MITESLTPATEIGSGLVVVYVTAPWCGPCKSYGPQVEKLALEYPAVNFVKVDADQGAEGLAELQAKFKLVIRSVPTTLCFDGTDLHANFVGAQIPKLTEFLDINTSF